jgi:hypothetical protein
LASRLLKLLNETLETRSLYYPASKKQRRFISPDVSLP